MRAIAAILFAIIAGLFASSATPARADGVVARTEPRATPGRSSVTRVTVERGVRVYRALAVPGYAYASAYGAVGFASGAQHAYAEQPGYGYYGAGYYGAAYYGGYGYGYATGLPAARHRHQRFAAVANPALLHRGSIRPGVTSAHGAVVVHRPAMTGPVPFGHGPAPHVWAGGGAPSMTPGGPNPGLIAGPGGGHRPAPAAMPGRMSGPGGHPVGHAAPIGGAPRR